MKVLVTGSSGHLGRLICPHLIAAGLTVRGFDRASFRGAWNTVPGELENLPALRRALRNSDAVIHLAACPDEADFATLLRANITGTCNLLEAVRLERIRRVVFASSIQVVAGLIGRRKVLVTDRAPTNQYALTKLWGEDMGRMHAATHGFTLIVARLGWVIRNTRERTEMLRMPGGKHWVLEPADLREFFLRSVTAGVTAPTTVYVVSHTGRTWFDLRPARLQMGFKPVE